MIGIGREENQNNGDNETKKETTEQYLTKTSVETQIKHPHFSVSKDTSEALVTGPESKQIIPPETYILSFFIFTKNKEISFKRLNEWMDNLGINYDSLPTSHLFKIDVSNTVTLVGNINNTEYIRQTDVSIVKSLIKFFASRVPFYDDNRIAIETDATYFFDCLMNLTDILDSYEELKVKLIIPELAQIYNFMAQYCFANDGKSGTSLLNKAELYLNKSKAILAKISNNLIHHIRLYMENLYITVRLAWTKPKEIIDETYTSITSKFEELDRLIDKYSSQNEILWWRIKSKKHTFYIILHENAATKKLKVEYLNHAKDGLESLLEQYNSFISTIDHNSSLYSDLNFYAASIYGDLGDAYMKLGEVEEKEEYQEACYSKALKNFCKAKDILKISGNESAAANWINNCMMHVTVKKMENKKQPQEDLRSLIYYHKYASQFVEDNKLSASSLLYPNYYLAKGYYLCNDFLSASMYLNIFFKNASACSPSHYKIVRDMACALREDVLLKVKDSEIESVGDNEDNEYLKLFLSKIHYLIASTEDDSRLVIGGIGIYSGALAKTIKAQYPQINVEWYTKNSDDKDEQIDPENNTDNMTIHYLASKSSDASKEDDYEQFRRNINERVRRRVLDIIGSDIHAIVIIDSQEMGGLLSATFEHIESRDPEIRRRILKVSRVHSPMRVTLNNIRRQQDVELKTHDSKQEEMKLLDREIRQLNGSDVLSFPSQYGHDVFIAQDAHKKLSNKNICVVPNPVCELPAHIEEENAIEYLIRLLKENKDSNPIYKKSNYNIFIVGRLEGRKGVEVVAKSAEILLKKIKTNDNEIHFYFIGQYKGENSHTTTSFTFLMSKDEVLKLGGNNLEQYFHFVGNVNRSHLGSILNLGSIFPICYLADTLPTTLIEIGLANKPMIALMQGGIPEIIDASHNKDTPLLLHKPSPELLAECLFKFYMNSNIYSTQRFRDYLLKKYNPNKTVIALLYEYATIFFRICMNKAITNHQYERKSAGDKMMKSGILIEDKVSREEKFSHVDNLLPVPASELVAGEHVIENMPLSLAIKRGESVTEIAKLRQGEDCSAEKDEYGFTPLHYAVALGRSDLLATKYFQEDFDWNVTHQENGLAPVHLAVLLNRQPELILTLERRSARESTVRYSLSLLPPPAGKQEDLRGNIHLTAFHLAIAEGQVGSLEHFFKHKGEAWDVEGLGNVFHLAVLSNQALLVRVLLNHFLSQNQNPWPFLESKPEPHKMTVLSYAAACNRPFVLREILDYYTRNPDQTKKQDQFVEALAYGIRYGAKEAVRCLLEYDDDNYCSKECKLPGDAHSMSALARARELPGNYNLIRNNLKNHQEKKEERRYRHPNLKEERIENLIFQGGGVKGIAYVGALEALSEQLMKKEEDRALGIGKKVDREVEVKEEKEVKGAAKGEKAKKAEKRSQDFPGIHRVAGTSAGAITATLVALGFKVKEIRAILQEAPFGEFLDGFNIEQFKKSGGFSKMKMLVNQLEPNPSIWTTLLGPLTWYQTIFSAEGLCQGDRLISWLSQRIAAKLEKTCQDHPELRKILPNPFIKEINGVSTLRVTLGDIAKLQSADPCFKHLHVIAVRLAQGAPGGGEEKATESRIETFSSEDRTVSDVLLIDAIRASMSIPGVFIPWRLRYRAQNGEVLTSPESAPRYVDGGILKNYPIEHFDKFGSSLVSAFAGGDSDYRMTHRNTLGFKLYTPLPKEGEKKGEVLAASSMIHRFKEAITQLVDKIKSIPKEMLASVEKKELVQLIKQIGECYWSAEGMIAAYQGTEKGRTILISNAGIGTVDFNLSDEDKEALVQAGKSAVEEFFNKKSTPVITEQVSSSHSSSSNSPRLSLSSNASTMPSFSRSLSPSLSSTFSVSTSISHNRDGAVSTDNSADMLSSSSSSSHQTTRSLPPAQKNTEKKHRTVKVPRPSQKTTQASSSSISASTTSIITTSLSHSPQSSSTGLRSVPARTSSRISGAVREVTVSSLPRSSNQTSSSTSLSQGNKVKKGNLDNRSIGPEAKTSAIGNKVTESDLSNEVLAPIMHSTAPDMRVVNIDSISSGPGISNSSASKKMLVANLGKSVPAQVQIAALGEDTTGQNPHHSSLLKPAGGPS